MYRNWALVHANRKRRWEAMDEQGKRHMLEEAELNKKAKTLKELMTETTDGYSLTIGQHSYSHRSIMRMLEWGFDVQWGIKVKITKYPGIRFEKLENSNPILKEDDKLKQKLGLINKEAVAAENAMQYAISKVKDPEVSAALTQLLNVLKSKENK